MDVKRVLSSAGQHPGSEQRPSPAHDAGDALSCQGKMAQEDASVQGHIVHALLRLVLDHVDEVVRRHRLYGVQF